MNLLYITTSIPWGPAETFILPEMAELKANGVCLTTIPRNPSKAIFYEDAHKFIDNSIWLPLVNPQMIYSLIKGLLTKITIWKILAILIKNSRNISILIKNIAIFPKAIFIAGFIKSKNIDHIHAHWGATTATMALIISQLTKIPWSLTLHRGDIKENNMLFIKTKSASFIRCISDHGKNELLQIINDQFREKIHVIHMGILIPEKNSMRKNNHELFTIAVPAALIKVKGHKYLIDALSILVSRNKSKIKCYFYGQGPEEKQIAGHISKMNLQNIIEVSGNLISHEKLMNLYRDQKINTVILPSINTEDGEHEGIPVSLMEAMAYFIPVISTETGAIPELIGDGSGIMIKEKDPESIADAIERLMGSPSEYQSIGEKGRNKVEKNFDISSVSKDLEKLFELNRRQQQPSSSVVSRKYIQ